MPCLKTAINAFLILTRLVVFIHRCCNQPFVKQLTDRDRGVAIFFKAEIIAIPEAIFLTAHARDHLLPVFIAFITGLHD